MLTEPTPLVRLRSLGEGRSLLAKLESLHPSGAVYDRVAAAVIARARSAGQALVIAGDALWTLSLLAAAARAEAPVAALVVSSSTFHEHTVLLRDTGLTCVRVDAADLARAAAATAQERGAVVVPADAADAFATTLGAELVRDLAQLGRAVVFAPDDTHGLVEGLRRAGVTVHGVRAGAQSASLVGLQQGADPRALFVAPDAALALRFRAARTEGLLVGHTSAAVLAAALAAPLVDGESAVAVIIDAGDRVFSQDAEAAA